MCKIGLSPSIFFIFSATISKPSKYVFLSPFRPLSPSALFCAGHLDVFEHQLVYELLLRHRPVIGCRLRPFDSARKRLDSAASFAVSSRSQARLPMPNFSFATFSLEASLRKFYSMASKCLNGVSTLRLPVHSPFINSLLIHYFRHLFVISSIMNLMNRNSLGDEIRP